VTPARFKYATRKSPRAIRDLMAAGLAAVPLRGTFRFVG